MPLRRFVYNLLTFSHMNSAILIANHPAAVMLINIVISMAAVIYMNVSTLITPSFLFYNPFVRDYKSQYYAKKIKSLSSLDKPKKFCNSLISLALNSV